MKKSLLLVNAIKHNKFMVKCTLKLWLFCAVYFTLISHSVGQVQQQQVVFPTQSVHSIDGIAWASSIGNNFITGSQFWVYINPSLEAVVAKKSSNGTITTKVLMQNVSNDNNHAEFSLGVDNEGYIHVIGGQHNSSPQYYVSTNPDDITSFDFRGNDLSLGGLQGTQMTYQSFVRSNKGTLFVSYRNNVVEDFVTGARSIALARYDTKTKKWTMIGGTNYQITNTSCQTITGAQAGITAFVWNNSGVGDMRPPSGKCFSQAHYQGYQLKIKFDQNNGMHVSYNMADSINMASGQDVSKYMTHLFYAYSPDEGSTWYKANGNQITTFPITKTTGDLVYKRIPSGYLYPATTSTPTMPNASSLILDKDGVPIVIQFDYIANNTLMFKWNGTSWVNQTSYTNRSDRFYTDLSNKIIYNFGSSQQFQMSYDNMATFTNNVTMTKPAAWYVVVDDYYLTKARNVMYYARDETAGQATIMNMVVAPTDVTAPAAPTGLSSSDIAQNSITLNWTASSELDVARYDVYRNGTLVGSTGSKYYTITGLSPSTSYALTVKAVDGSGNVSPISSTLTVSTSAVDNQLPGISSGLSATAVSGSSFKINWNAATDNVGVVSYEIYKDGVFLASTAYTSYKVTGLSGNTTYGISVRAKDAAGNLSYPVVLNVKTFGSGLITYEPYNYTVGTSNNDPDAGMNGGAGLPATNTGGNPTGTGTGLRETYGAEASVVTGLAYSNLATSGAAHNITNATWGSTVYLYRNMTTDPFLSKRLGNSNTGNFGIDGQSLYLSFIAKTSSSTAGAFSFAISNGSRNVYIENSANGWSLNDNKGGAVTTTATLELNTPTLLVIKIDFNAGAADVVSLYKNPPIDGTLGTPNATLTVGVDFTLNSFNTRPNVANAMTLDEFRMGLSYADVTPSVAVVATQPDTEPPTVPTGLSSANITQTSFTLNWASSTDNVAVTGYEIFRNGISIGTTTSTTFNVTGLIAGTTYSMTVRASDALGYSNVSQALSVITSPATLALRTADNPANTAAGLDYKYYEGTWSSLPNFDTLTPIKTGTVTSFDLTPKNRADNFGFKYTGFVNVPQDGEYTFYTSSDDGSKLYIGNTQVVDNDGNHATQERSGTIGLKAGKHAISVIYYEATGGEALTISYSSPTLSKVTIPASALYRSVQTTCTALPLASSGTIIGSSGSYNNSASVTKDKALDGNTSTYFDGSTANGQWVGRDLGSPQTICSIRIYPRSGYASRMTNGKFQGSSTADFSSDVNDLTGLLPTPASNAWTNVTVTNNNAYRYVRYLAPDNSYGNVAEIEFSTLETTGSTMAVQDNKQLQLNGSTAIEKNITIYPNPVKNGWLTVGLNDLSVNKKLDVLLVDLSGRIVYKNSFTSNGISEGLNISAVQPGIYIIQVTGVNTNFSSKLIVQ